MHEHEGERSGSDNRKGQVRKEAADTPSLFDNERRNKHGPAESPGPALLLRTGLVGASLTADDLDNLLRAPGAHPEVCRLRVKALRGELEDAREELQELHALVGELELARHRDLKTVNAISEDAMGAAAAMMRLTAERDELVRRLVALAQAVLGGAPPWEEETPVSRLASANLDMLAGREVRS